MRMLHRKSRWEKLSDQMVKSSGKLASGIVVRAPSMKAGAAAATGAVALTAASAVVSVLRRRTNS